MVEKSVTIMNKTGLHARPAAEFVKKASTFKSKVEIIKDEKRINGKSILGVLSLGASQGATIIIRTEGEDEEEALNSLLSLVESKFGERE